jgi:small-conductance mechanosensitive channel
MIISTIQPLLDAVRPWLRRQRWRSLPFVGALLVILVGAFPADAVPVLAQFSGTGGGSSNAYTLGWVELDGVDVFQVAAPSSAIHQRRQQIHQNLQEIADEYLALESPVANLTTVEAEEGQPQVYVNGQYLMTVTDRDAELQGLTQTALVQNLRKAIPQTLERAYQHRQPDYRQQQYLRIGLAAVLVIATIIVLNILSDRLVRSAVRHLGASLNQEEITDDQRHQLQDLRDRMMPLVYGLLLSATIIWAIGLFPESRVLQQELLSTLKVPIIVGIVVVIAYIGIRLTYTVVDKVAQELTDENGFSSHYSRRARLRISTLSSVIKNITNFVWIGIGFLIALSITGLDLGLLLASVGIIGLALSLAAQNLIQGAIKGFFIVLEDQFAIGDVVKIGEDAGLVEKLNLRITQLRDTDGRLITIPTSDINRVANYSLHWSRADLKIPVHYNADINHMLDITRQVGAEMQQDPEWGHLILEDPKILGIDDFGDSAVIIRVWIKTEPMKQWDVSREYRRRFKEAVESAGTEIPFPQRDVWLHPSEALQATLRGIQSNGSSNGQSLSSSAAGRSPAAAKTDAQPPLTTADDDGDGDGDGDGEPADAQES